MASRGVNIFVQLGSTFVLMRYFLTPDDVGLVGMVTVFTGLAPVLIDVGANLVGSIGAIAMAFAGWHYWALVLKPIIAALFTLSAVCYHCRWVPGIPRLTEGVKEMLRFGLNVTGFTLTDYIGRAADRFAIGGKGGTSELGYY